MKSYREQQRERLSEAVFDYLSDENTTAEELISDFYAEVKSSFDYFDKYAKKCEKVMNTLPKNDDCSHSEHYYDYGRNKTYDQMIAEGYTMSGEGFWIPSQEKKNPRDTMRVNYPEAGSEEWEKFWSEIDE